jgi:hypothetical protein
VLLLVVVVVVLLLLVVVVLASRRRRRRRRRSRRRSGCARQLDLEAATAAALATAARPGQLDLELDARRARGHAAARLAAGQLPCGLRGAARGIRRHAVQRGGHRRRLPLRLLVLLLLLLWLQCGGQRPRRGRLLLRLRLRRERRRLLLLLRLRPVGHVLLRLLWRLLPRLLRLLLEPLLLVLLLLLLLLLRLRPVGLVLLRLLLVLLLALRLALLPGWGQRAHARRHGRMEAHVRPLGHEVGLSIVAPLDDGGGGGVEHVAVGPHLRAGRGGGGARGCVY